MVARRDNVEFLRDHAKTAKVPDQNGPSRLVNKIEFNWKIVN